jgi:putative ABC transport system permease protein
MIRYYLLLFVRNLQRQRMFSFINLLGLTTGIVSTLLIYLYVQHELSHDRFHTKANRIYRINQTFIWGDDKDQLFSSLGPGVAHAITEEIPEAEEVTRIHQPANSSIISYISNNEKRSFDEKKLLVVDSNFFRVFTFPLLKGKPESALVDPNTLVMTTSTAKKYFGDEDPIGKFVQVNGFIENEPDKTFEVTGIVDDTPDNSYIEFDMLVSMNSIPRVRKASWSWMWTMFETFVLLHDKASPQALQTKLNALPEKHAVETLEAMGTTYADYTKSGKEWKLYMQPITDIHLYSGTMYNRLNSVGNITILYVLTGVVAFILLLSCINFMNLSTAQYTRRMKETSLRKVLGSNRLQLGLSFFLEAFLFCTIALLIGAGLTQLVLPYFNTITGNNYHLRFTDPAILTVIALLLFGMSVLCGSYPSIFLSAFKPIEAMKGKLTTGKKGKLLRSSLVVFQFAISLILIVCTLIVFKQLKFLSNKDVGFNRENLLVVSRLEWVNDKSTFIHALEGLDNVEEVSWCSSVPPTVYDGDSFNIEGDRERTINLNYVKADAQYAPALGLKFVTGRNFEKDAPADNMSVILNETAAREIGWATDESIIGKKVFYAGDQQYRVIGVVKDFNYWSLAAAIEPMAIFNMKGLIFSANRQYAVMRIRPETGRDVKKLISELQTEWKQFTGEAPFYYDFVDQSFATSFEGEERFGQALSIFAVLAILIASLGLLGMIIFTLELRTKEIGIRKVNGASEFNIITLISKDYTKLILIAIFISIPVSIVFMNQWLEGFLYRIKITADVFVIAAISTLFVAMLITSYHSVKAALTNPIDVLKDE